MLALHNNGDHPIQQAGIFQVQKIDLPRYTYILATSLELTCLIVLAQLLYNS